MRRKVTRRRILGEFMVSTVAAVIAIPGIDTILEPFGVLESYRNCVDQGPPDSPVSHENFRRAGMVLGLRRAAQERIVSGQGLLVVGASHLSGLSIYSKNPHVATDVYRHRLQSLPPEGSPLGPSPVQLWMPRNQPNQWRLAKEFPRR